MAKTNTVQIKLVSSADTGFFYVTQEERPHADRQAGAEEIRSGGAQARRVPRSQDQVATGVPATSQAATEAANSTRLRPARLAAYSATSAACSNASGVIGCCLAARDADADGQVRLYGRARRQMAPPPPLNAARSAAGCAPPSPCTGHHHHELLAAVARQRVEHARVGAQHVGDRAQRPVTGGVAVLVVDALEVIDVDHQHGEVAVERALQQPAQMAASDSAGCTGRSADRSAPSPVRRRDRCAGDPGRTSGGSGCGRGHAARSRRAATPASRWRQGRSRAGCSRAPPVRRSAAAGSRASRRRRGTRRRASAGLPRSTTG